MKNPKLCVTPKGVYFIYVNRKKIYLGKGDKEAINIRYKALLKKLNDNTVEFTPEDADPLSIVELSARFIAAHKTYYRHAEGTQDKQLDRFRTALSFPLSLFPTVYANDFGAKRLIETRDAMVATGRFSRTYINTLVKCLRHVFKWAVENELVKPDVLMSLKAVSPLKRGRSTAKERPAVQSVSPEIVEATLPFLPPTVAAIVKVQRYTGMRPSEVLNMRVRDLVDTGSGYKYTLESDKSDYRRAVGDKRIVNLGANAAAAVRPFLKNKEPENLVFPTDPKTDTPYTACSYGRAITRAAKKAKVDHWTPYQLRHLFATEVRAQFGLEAAQTVLGHKSADVTQIYAERDNSLAEKVAVQIG